MAQILDGQAIAHQVRAEVKDEVEALVRAGRRPPHLAVVLVGEDPASASYVRGKHKAATEVGIAGGTHTYDAGISEEKLLGIVADLNADDDVDGILVQLPLPPHIDEHKVIDAILPEKDVDGFHPENIGRVVIGRPSFAPATPSGILEMLERSGLHPRGKHVVIVGRSNIVGKPLANLLVQKGIDATVTVCHSRTPDLGAFTRQADILVAAVGQAHLIRADMVREGAVVIDVGVNRVDDPTRPRGYRLVGDVDFDAVKEKASWITPVPGGVGPMTIAMLLKNTLKAYLARTA